MKIVMTLLVRDERDIIRYNLDYHLARGVDFFLVMDHCSTDGTPAILDEYRRAGVAEVFTQTDPGYHQGQWVTWMARRAAARYGAEWVINNDADEFWWPEEGDLKSVLAQVPESCGSVSVVRHNFPPTANTHGDFLERMVCRDTASTNSLNESLPGKACHRGHPQVVVSQGNHWARVPGLERCFDDVGMEILHFPVRSLQQIENKIALGGRAYEMSSGLDKDLGHSWRSLYETLKRGGLEDYYRSTCLCREDLTKMGEGGRVVVDERLRDFMRTRQVRR